MHPKKILLFVLFLALLLPIAPSAEMRPVRKARPGAPPHDVLGEIFAANVRSASVTLEAKQGPALTWLTDCEAAIRPELIAARGQRLFTVRTLGNQLVTGLAAVDYGIRHLHTPVLLITANTGNESVRLFMEGYDRLPREIRGELDHLHPALLPAAPGGDRKDFAEQWRANVERNVDYQVKQALDRYRERVADGRLVVAGTILDLENAYGRGKGRLLLINLNGEADPEKIRRSPHLVRFPPEARKMAIGRETVSGKR